MYTGQILNFKIKRDSEADSESITAKQQKGHIRQEIEEETAKEGRHCGMPKPDKEGQRQTRYCGICIPVYKR